MNIIARTVIGENESTRVILLKTREGYSVDVASDGFITGRGYPRYAEAFTVYTEAVDALITSNL